MSRGTGNPGMGDPYEQGYIAGMREVYYSVPAENIYDQPGEEYDSEQWHQGYIVGIVNAKKKNGTQR